MLPDVDEKRYTLINKMDSTDLDQTAPVTEQSNPLSRNIDISSPREIVSILNQCDEEIFNGWAGSRGLNEDEILTTIEEIASKIEGVIKSPSRGLVCMGGCGTSGRLAYLASHTFNNYLNTLGKEPCFHYIMAGNDKALFTSQELAEDDPHTGSRVLDQVTTGKSKVVYIGISCGLSASFVAGQLDHCLVHLDKFTPVVLGFNPSHLARELPIPNWSKTFLSVTKELVEVEKTGKAFVLNPIIGPDPITGSSRMKSGSATRILLEVLSMAAIHGYKRKDIINLVACYKQTCDSVYRYGEQLGTLIEMAGDSLRSCGHIYYIGCEGKAVMAMIDASECPPTYGAALDDVRGFIDGGYQALQNNDGDLSSFGKEYRISIQDFETSILPNICEKDLVVLVGEENLQKVGNDVLKAKCKKVLISFENQNLASELHKDFHLVLRVQLDVPALQSVVPDSAKDIMGRFLQEMAVKWILNSLSTGGHILKGKVCGNWMVDVRASNTKLYLRAIGIIQVKSVVLEPQVHKARVFLGGVGGRDRIASLPKISNCDKEEAETNLLRSIYETDVVGEDVWHLSIVDHIKTAGNRDKIVPTAILMACQKCSLKEAKEKIQMEPVIRKLLLN